jgi:DNA (cytosine-5)-methyltransferase 1
LQSNIKTNYSAIEIFAGIVGATVGFGNAGINHKLLVEIDKNACKTW